MRCGRRWGCLDFDFPSANQTSRGQRAGLEREMHVGAQVLDPQLAGPRGFGGRPLVEEQHVRLHALGVEQAGGQAHQSSTLQ